MEINQLKLSYASEVLRVCENYDCRNIIKVLNDGEMRVTDIYCALNADQSRISMLLRDMLNVGIIEKRKQGRFMYVKLNREKLGSIAAAVSVFREEKITH